MPDIFVDPETKEAPEPLQETPKPIVTAPEIEEIKKQPRKRGFVFLKDFFEHPAGIRFKNQEDDEEILLFLRRHMITNIYWLIITFLLLIAPLVIVPFIVALSLFPFEIPPNYGLVLGIFYYLVVFCYGFINFLYWFYNIGIITDRRVVDVDYSGIIYVHVAATIVSKIEDVSYAQTGFLRTLFNYGDVSIRTAAQVLDFEFLRVPHPSKVTFIIQKLIRH